MRFRLLALLALLATVPGCEPTAPAGPSDPATEEFAASLGVDIASMIQVEPSVSVYYKDMTVGTGATAVLNKQITVAYTGYLSDGTSFDSGQIGPIPLNTSNLISGWVLGVPGMKVGGKRKLVIGSSYGYGAGGNPPKVPGNATLVFDMELKEVK